MCLNDTGEGELSMDMVHLAYLFAVAVGIVTAGVTASLWTLVVGEEPRFGLLLEPSAVAPLRALVIAASAPLLLLLAAWRYVGSASCGHAAGGCKFGLELFAGCIYPDAILRRHLNGNPLWHFMSSTALPLNCRRRGPIGLPPVPMSLAGCGWREMPVSGSTLSCAATMN